jgi:hypothetical protein
MRIFVRLLHYEMTVQNCSLHFITSYMSGSSCRDRIQWNLLRQTAESRCEFLHRFRDWHEPPGQGQSPKHSRNSHLDAAVCPKRLYWLHYLCSTKIKLFPLNKCYNIFKFSGAYPSVMSGIQWRSWLRHCASSRKVAVSVFHWHNPSGRTMALGSTQPLTEMSTTNISWGLKAAGV